MTVIEKLKDTLRRRPERLTREEYLAKLLRSGYNADGSPKLDPVPLAPPIGYKKQPSMVEIIRDMIRSNNLATAAAAAGAETFEESEDFDIPDDPVQLVSQWENQHDPSLDELLTAGKEIERLKAKKQEEAKKASPEVPPAAAAKVGDPPSDGPATPPLGE